MMLYSVNPPCWPDHVVPGGDGPCLLPETSQLLQSLRSARAPGDLKTLRVPCPNRIAFYRAQPERNLSFVWFSIAEADPNLLEFTGTTVPGFEVLQVQCGGFEYHWRSDLTRAMEEEVPLLGRLYGTSDTRELVIEHVALPIIQRSRVEEIHGWFTFSQELNSYQDWASLSGSSAFRRAERPKPVQLPSSLSRPDRSGTLARSMLGAIKAPWRSFGSRRTPSETSARRY